MLKKIFLLLLILTILGFIIFAIFKFQESKIPVSNSFNAIPTDAVLLFTSKNYPSLWEEISATNLMWKDLCTINSFKKADNDLNFIDSLYKKFDKLQEILNNNSLIISLHQSGANSFDALYTISLPKNYGKDKVNKLITKILKSPNIESRVYDNVDIYILKLNDGRKLNYSVHNGIFISSFSPLLIEDAIRQINSDISILDNKDFKRVMETADKYEKANLYINFKRLKNLLSPYLKNKYKTLLSNFASWTELDLSLKANYLRLNGFTSFNDSNPLFINLFSNQIAQKIEIINVLPKNTASFLYYSFSDFNSFYKNYKDYLKEQQEIFNHKKYIDEINKTYKTDIEENLLSWIYNEIAYVITEPLSTDFKANTYLLIKTNNIDKCLQKLDKLINDISKNSDRKVQSDSYDSFIIKQLPLNNPFSKLLGQQFNGLIFPYFTRIKNYIVFSNQKQSLILFINYYLQGNTLSNDLGFIDFFENLSSESNILLYSNIGSSINIYKHYCSNKLKKDIKKSTEILKNFQAFAHQIKTDRKNKLFYNNIELKYNPNYNNKNTNSLWRVKIDTNLIAGPFLVKNHYTNAYEIFLQDKNKKIYLINNKGEIEWTRQLNEKIESEVFQIDRYKNNKLQILFNTSSKIFLIDRKGRDVEGFPVKLPSMASNPINLFDYDNIKKYRILIACEDKKIYNYDKTGKQVKGWVFERTNELVQRPLQYFKIKNKDYIVAIDNGGKIYILNRRGENRIKIKKPLKYYSGKDFYIKKGKNIANTCIYTTDIKGNVLKQFLNGDTEILNFHTFSQKHYFIFADINNDNSNEFIFVDSTKLEVYNYKKELLFSYDFDYPIRIKAKYFISKDNYGNIVIVEQDKKNIFMFDFAGNIKQGFPLYGSSQVAIGDINKDKTIDMVTSDNYGYIYTYSIE